MGVENGHWPFSLRQMNQGVSLVRDFLWYLEPTSASVEDQNWHDRTITKTALGEVLPASVLVAA